MSNALIYIEFGATWPMLWGERTQSMVFLSRSRVS